LLLFFASQLTSAQSPYYPAAVWQSKKSPEVKVNAGSLDRAVNLLNGNTDWAIESTSGVDTFSVHSLTIFILMGYSKMIPQQKNDKPG